MIIKSPYQISNELKSIFLAGGISNCSDWQSEVTSKINHDNVNIINPRRDVWDNTRSNEEVSKEQILWEYNYITHSNAMAFWFPKETLCPITLFELGAALHTKNILVIGIDPDYQRKMDIEVQTSLVNKNIPIVYDLDSFVTTINSGIEKL